VIKNGRVVLESGVVEADLAIDDGRILSISKNLEFSSSSKVVDARGRIVFPGAIDSHTHPGGKHDLGEDFHSETPGALLGGVTTIGAIVRSPRVGRPFKEYTSPEDAVSWLSNFETGVQIAKRNSVADFVFTLTLNTMQHASEIPDCVEKLGVSTFKYHGNLKNVSDHPMGLKWAQRMALPVSYDDSLLFEAMQCVGRLGRGRIYLHCENSEISKLFRGKLRESGRKDPLAWTEGLPGFLEADHIRRYSYYSAQTNAPIHILHVTSSEGVDEISRAKKSGVRITAETCPQYLLIDPNEAGFLGKLNPPLRQERDREALWGTVLNGTIDTIGTDHVVSNKYEKLVWGDGSEGGDPASDIWSTGSGSVGTQTMLPVMFWEAVNKRSVALTRLAELVSTNPAKIAGIYPKKGVIAVGSEADFTIIDPRKKGKITNDWLSSNADFTLFDEFEGEGWPVMTILRGEVAMEDGQVLVSHGFGNNVRAA